MHQQQMKEFNEKSSKHIKYLRNNFNRQSAKKAKKSEKNNMKILASHRRAMTSKDREHRHKMEIAIDAHKHHIYVMSRNYVE